MPLRTLPVTLTARDLVVDRGPRRILAGLSLTVAPGTCFGVVGANGSGKSTLLRVLAGLDPPDRGSVRADPPTAVVGYLAQEHDAEASETVRQLLHRRSGALAAETDLAAAAEDLGRGAPGADDRYGVALEHLQSLGVGDLDARIDAVLPELGLDPAFAGHPAASCSGGQRARVALAAVVLSRFDVTLLDEPTNDLDFDGLERLERFVEERTRTGPGGVVVVSHDRAFLERCVTDVMELDEHRPSGRTFSGGWKAYLEEKAVSAGHAAEAYSRYEARRRALGDRAQRERQWATSGVRREHRAPRDHDKAQRDFRLNRTEQLASRARRTERALERLDVVDKPWEGWQLRFTIREARRAGAVVASLDQAEIRRGSFGLGPLDLEVAWGERVALTGANGTGKSTLVAALVGRLPLAAGRQRLGPSVVVGELGQDRAAGDDGVVLELATARSGLTVSETRSLLAKFSLGPEQVDRLRSSLSPGERTRLELAMFQARGVNFLVLDEPTNHLDLPAIEQLEEALETFTGALLLVTHDRRLLDAVGVTRTVATADLARC